MWIIHMDFSYGYAYGSSMWFYTKIYTCILHLDIHMDHPRGFPCSSTWNPCHLRLHGLQVYLDFHLDNPRENPRGYFQQGLDLFRHLNTKTYGAHHRDSIMSHLEYLVDPVFNLFWRLDTKTYWAHHLDSIIGHLVHLDQLDLFRLLDTKTYGAHHLDCIIGHREHLDRVVDLFWQLDT